MALLQKMTAFNGDHTNSKVYLEFSGDFDVDEITSIIGLILRVFIIKAIK